MTADNMMRSLLDALEADDWKPGENLGPNAQREVTRLVAEREKWKALAEFHYGMKTYPQDVGLGRGALDAFYRREWDNGRYEAFLEQAEQAAARSTGAIR